MEQGDAYGVLCVRKHAFKVDTGCNYLCKHIFVVRTCVRLRYVAFTVRVVYNQLSR